MQPITMMLLRFGEDILITLEKMKTSRDELMNNNEKYFFLKVIWSVQKCSSFTPTQQVYILEKAFCVCYSAGVNTKYVWKFCLSKRKRLEIKMNDPAFQLFLWLIFVAIEVSSKPLWRVSALKLDY